MIYIGLLTDAQKRAGYFTTQDEDFVYLWHRRNSNPECIKVFLYETARIKEIREAAVLGCEVKVETSNCPG